MTLTLLLSLFLVQNSSDATPVSQIGEFRKEGKALILKTGIISQAVTSEKFSLGKYRGKRVWVSGTRKESTLIVDHLWPVESRRRDLLVEIDLLIEPEESLQGQDENPLRRGRIELHGIRPVAGNENCPCTAARRANRAGPDGCLTEEENRRMSSGETSAKCGKCPIHHFQISSYRFEKGEKILLRIPRIKKEADPFPVLHFVTRVGNGDLDLFREVSEPFWLTRSSGKSPLRKISRKVLIKLP
jgi:hypothetical protein